MNKETKMKTNSMSKEYTRFTKQLKINHIQNLKCLLKSVNSL